MKTLIQNLVLQLSSISYAKDSGYSARDVSLLIQEDKFPFYNVVPDNMTLVRLPNEPFNKRERAIYTVLIQYGVKNMNANVCIMGDSNFHGILDFTDDIWAAIKSDRTIGGAVQGILPDSQIPIEVVDIVGRSGLFYAGREMTIQFFNDYAV